MSRERWSIELPAFLGGMILGMLVFLVWYVVWLGASK